MRQLIGYLVFLAYMLPIAQAQSSLSEERLEFIARQEEVVRKIAAEATESHSRRVQLVRECNCSRHVCSNEFGSEQSTCVLDAGTPEICTELGHEGRLLDNTTSAFGTPPGENPSNLRTSIKENVCVYKRLNNVFTTFGFDEVGSIYFATRDGHHRRYPAGAERRGEEDGDVSFGGCRSFDPRLRPWYIGASTGPKDIVLVVDKSGSMKDFILDSQRSKWNLTIQAVSDILDTFTFTDFINVVTFSDIAVPLWKESGLVRGRREGLRSLKQELRNASPEGETNFAEAFNVSFQLLTNDCNAEPKSCSNCQKILLFLTDGKDTSVDNKSIRPSKMLNLIDDLQQILEERTGSRASIFTFSMSDEADDSIPRQIACANDGAWTFIGLNTSTLNALNSYYLYFADGRRMVDPVWTEPYEDITGSGMVASVAVPVFARGTPDVPDVFLGVAGHDVLLDELAVDGFTAEDVLAEIVDRSEGCSFTTNTACELQAFRNASDRFAVCPDLYPTETNSSERSILCHQHREHFYKKFSEKLTWDDAASRCEADGGELVSINDEEELAFVAGLASADGTWVGAQANTTEQFSWISGNVSPLPHDSNYWGVGEPALYSAARHCVGIDRRGVIGNLYVKGCLERFEFICVYTNNTRCLNGTGELPETGYFRVPPLGECSQAAEVLVETLPLEEARDLQSNQVMCDLGLPKANKDIVCCNHVFPRWRKGVLFSSLLGSALLCVALF